MVQQQALCFEGDNFRNNHELTGYLTVRLSLARMSNPKTPPDHFHDLKKSSFLFCFCFFKLEPFGLYAEIHCNECVKLFGGNMFRNSASPTTTKERRNPHGKKGRDDGINSSGGE